MSLVEAIASAEMKQAKKIEKDTILVDYKGMPSLFKPGSYEPNMRTLAYRLPTVIAPKKNATDPDPAPGPVFEIDLLPGLNEIPVEAWAILKPSLDSLLKPGRRLVVVPVDEIQIKTGNETFGTEKWIKEKPLMIEYGKFSELTAERAASLIERCVSERLLTKFSKAFPNDENVQIAIEAQKTALDNAVIKQ